MRTFVFVPLVAIGLASSALAERARLGAVATPLVVSDLDNHPVAIPTGKKAVVFYEDDKTGSLNLRAHKVVATIVDRYDRKPGFDVLVVGDVERHNYWPARSFALKELRRVAKEERNDVYADWTGAFAKNWALPKGTPLVVVLAPDGTVKFVAQGVLNDKELSALETALLDGIAQR